MLAPPDNPPNVGTRFNAHIVWMSEDPLISGKQYYLKQTTRTVTGSVSRIHHRIDVNTLEHVQVERLKLNGIALCEVALNSPLAFDPYTRCKGTGSFIIIDRLTNVTVGAGMIVGVAEEAGTARQVTSEERAARFGQKAVTLWLRGANASELAYQLERRLFDFGHAVAVLDDPSLASSAGLIANSLNQAGLVCLSTLEKPSGPEKAGDLSLDVGDMQVDDLLDLLHERSVL